MVRVRLLGSLAIEVDSQAVDPPASRRAQALLGWLALHPGMHARGQMAGRFWPDVLDSSARQSLRSAVWSLKRALGPRGERVVRALRDEIGLDGVTTDLAEWEQHVEAGRLEEAIALERGDLLAGLDDDWVHEAREEHRVALAQAVERLADMAESAGDAQRALVWTRRWAALDPLAESPARALMRRLASTGERSAALTVYSRLRERMRLELGISPSGETRAVANALREREPESERRLPAADDGAIVGRSAELRRLHALRRGGRGGVVVLTGEGGIGKTRLAGELLRGAEADGAHTAVCAALDIGGAAPFTLWAELLRELVRSLPDPPSDAAWPGELARLLPELGEAPGPPAPPELERARLFEATVELFEWASGDRPLVVLVDDLHMADSASIELLAYVGRRTPGMDALIVVTRRDAPRRAEVDAAIDALSRRGSLLDDLRLGALATADLETLVRAVAALPDAEVARVADVAEGNALLAVESARAAAAGEHGPPATLRSSVRAQLAALDDEARDLAELLAVAGRELDRRECAAAGVGDAELAEAATAAADCGLVAAAAGRIGYRHGLLREAVYDELPDPRRAWLHERLAGGLEAAAEPGSGTRDAEVARHLLLAGNADRAVEHLRRAAAHARGVAALTEAAGFLREALETAPEDASLWLELAEVEAWRQRIEESNAAFQRALGLLSPRDPEPVVEAWLRRARWFRGAECSPRDSHDAYDRAIEVMDGAGMEAPRRRAEALAGCAWCSAAAGDASSVDDLLAQVHALLDGESPDDLLTHDVGAARQFALMRAGRFVESYGPGIAAGEAAQRAGRPDMAYGAWGNTAAAAAAIGELDRALEFAERSLFAARGTGTPLECVVLSAKAQILCRMGRLDEAREIAQAEHDLADRLDRPDLAAASDYDLGVIALRGDQFQEAAALFEAALATGGPFTRPVARLNRAEALARSGSPGEAEHELRETTLEPVGQADFPATLVARLTRVQGLVALARGDRELAARRLSESAAAWRRNASAADEGAAYLANLIDLGRPAITGLVEPAVELARVESELEALRATVA
jgi:DNA-binding SARP family transcriptional activator/tetratricopeptide (TPR) repeat protein